MYDRIVSLAPSNTEILYALGAEDRVVATTAVCDYPETAREKPSVGGWTNPDVNAVAEHDPDIVLASDALQDAAVDRCRDAGLPVRQFTPTRLRDVCNTVKVIGELVGQEDAAQEIVDDVNEDIRSMAQRGDTTARVYCEEWHEPPMVSGNWVPDIVSLLGGEYLIDGGERSRRVSTAEVQRFDPEYVFIHLCGFGDSAETTYVTERDGWQEITAVENGNVYVLDDSLLNRPGPRLVDGMRELQEHFESDIND